MTIALHGRYNLKCTEFARDLYENVFNKNFVCQTCNSNEADLWKNEATIGKKWSILFNVDFLYDYNLNIRFVDFVRKFNY